MTQTPPEEHERGRARQLVSAGIALNSELTLDGVLERLVESAAGLTEARFAALGVLDPSHQRLERFITFGLDGEARARIGDLPTGRGILGVLIDEAVPLRLADLMSDPRAVGFPAAHPPMHSFLGVPVLLRGIVYGNLYLTEKEGGGEFTLEDEDLVVALAAQAAVAIENARLYDSSTRWLRQLEAMNMIANENVREPDLGRVLQLIAVQARELLQARLMLIGLSEGDTIRIGGADGDGAGELLGRPLPATSTLVRRVFDHGSSRIDSIVDDPAVDQTFARRYGLTSALYAPLQVSGRTVGLVCAFDKQSRPRHFSDDDLRLLEALAARAAAAVDLRQNVSRETVRAILHAQEQERTRLARELHDETGQALTSILLGLKPLEPHVGAEALQPLRKLIGQALDDVRRLAVELRPAILDDFGLVPALERLAHSLETRSALAGQLHNDADRRQPPTKRTRDSALPDRPGSTRERRQARRRHARVYPPRRARRHRRAHRSKTTASATQATTSPTTGSA